VGPVSITSRVYVCWFAYLCSPPCHHTAPQYLTVAVIVDSIASARIGAHGGQRAELQGKHLRVGLVIGIDHTIRMRFPPIFSLQHLSLANEAVMISSRSGNIQWLRCRLPIPLLTSSETYWICSCSPPSQARAQLWSFALRIDFTIE